VRQALDVNTASPAAWPARDRTERSRSTIIRARPSRVTSAIAARPDTAVAQHHDLVADLDHLGDLCEMNTTEWPCSFSRRITASRLATSAGPRLDVGSSRMSSLAAQDRLDDLHALAKPEGQRRHHRFRVDDKPISAAGGFDPGNNLVGPQDGAGFRPAEHHVLGDGHRLDQGEVLVDHADAGGDRLARAVTGEQAPLEHDPAGIWPAHAEQHLHQGALAGSILAEQTDDAALRHREIDGAVGANRSIALHDSLHLQKCRQYEPSSLSTCRMG